MRDDPLVGLVFDALRQELRKQFEEATPSPYVHWGEGDDDSEVTIDGAVDLMRLARAMARAVLGERPSEPGRDRIAVWVPASAPPKFLVLPRGLDTEDVAWAALRPNVEGPVATGIIRCNLPRPAEPVEVEGSVEGVGPWPGDDA